MIVPGPARRHVDLEGDLAAQALAGGRLAERDGLGLLFFRFFIRKHSVPPYRRCEERSKVIAVIPGWSEGPDPESRDSGFDASHRPGMTERELTPAPARYARDNPYSPPRHRHKTSRGCRASAGSHAAGGAAGPGWR